jgi:FdhD protein
MYEILPCYGEEDGIYTARTHEVIIEEQYTIWVNGRKILNAMTSPTRLEEFVMGYLVTEGIISHCQEIDSLQIEGNQIRVLTIHRAHIRSGTKQSSQDVGETVHTLILQGSRTSLQIFTYPEKEFMRQ